MRSNVLLFGLVGALLIGLLQLIEFRWIVIEHSVEIYGGLVAIIFAGVGLWIGRRITTPKERVVVREVAVMVPAPVDFVRDEAQVAALRITPRELEILALIASGLSNQEIADKAFVSLNTVKTHSSRLFEKLNVKRRTHAVQQAKALRLIP